MFRRKLLSLVCGLGTTAFCAPAASQIKVDWTRVKLASNTTPTLQVVVNPLLERGSAIHDRAFSELHQLAAHYVRYVPWLPYPRLGVAELKKPP